MAKPAFNWQKFEDAMVVQAEGAVRTVMKQYPDESFYAVAFHEFYSEEWQQITLPCIAANTEEELDGDDDARWSSADWYWIDLPYQNRSIVQLLAALNSAANSSDVEHWHKLHNRMMQAIVRVAKILTERLKKQGKATRDFGVYVFADDHPEATKILRNCMTKTKFKRLFPHLQASLDKESAISRSPVDKKLKEYGEDLCQHGDKLIRMGEIAIPLLLDRLYDSKQQWKAANLLGKIGIRQDRIIQALRERARRPGELRFHETTALALLGDVDFLLKLTDREKSREAAIAGIKSLYSYAANNCVVPVPLDYTPIEYLLKKESCARLVKKADSPGGGVIALPSREIGVDSLDEAIRGVASKHRVIREHAVRCLGNRKLGKAAGVRALPLISALLNDRCFEVRRLAMLNLVEWKKDARPYLSELRKLLRDPDPDVRFWARYSLREM